MELFFYYFRGIDFIFVVITLTFLHYRLDELTAYLMYKHNEIWSGQLGSIRFRKEATFFSYDQSVFEGSFKNIRSLYKFIRSGYKELEDPILNKLVKKSQLVIIVHVVTLLFFLFLIPTLFYF